MHRVFTCFLLCMLLPLPAGADNGDVEKTEKFEELEAQYADSPERLKLAKAAWLTKRGNTYGQKGDMDRAVNALEEAVSVKPDYFPGYLSLALAQRAGEQYDKAIGTIESAPATMSYRGAELSGFEYDVYYVKMLVYAAIPDHGKGLEAAREGLEVLGDPGIQERRKQAEKAGIVAPGSGAQIVELLEKYAKVREARNPD